MFSSRDQYGPYHVCVICGHIEYPKDLQQDSGGQEWWESTKTERQRTGQVNLRKGMGRPFGSGKYG